MRILGDSELELAGTASGPVTIFWPATLFNARVSFPRKVRSEFHSSGISTLCFNPRGHGVNAGPYDLVAEAERLASWILETKELKGRPLIGLGHSGGASGILRCGEMLGEREFSAFFLFAPVFNGAEAIRYMFHRRSIDSFLRVFRGYGRDSVIDSLETDSSWLEPEVWESNDFASKLNFRVHKPGAFDCDSAAGLLQNLFVGGISLDLANYWQPERIRTLLPEDDSWVDQAANKALFASLNISHLEVQGAQNHFFDPKWEDAWRVTLSHIRELSL